MQPHAITAAMLLVARTEQNSHHAEIVARTTQLINRHVNLINVGLSYQCQEFQQQCQEFQEYKTN